MQSWYLLKDHTCTLYIAAFFNPNIALHDCTASITPMLALNDCTALITPMLALQSSLEIRAS